MTTRFLTARWEHLVMLNYEVDPAVLAPLVPAGTTPDTWRGRTLASLVGFRFRDTWLLGLPVPGHRNFDEVNLRFYVRREVAGETRRAVAFVKEIVPRAAIATVARWVYNEPYVARPMRHEDGLAARRRARAAGDGSGEPSAGGPARVAYAWREQGRWHELSATVAGEPALPPADSEAAFIAEHYWGYTAQRNGGTLEYQVEHPPWRVWPAVTSSFDGDAGSVYGPAWASVLAGPPRSAFVAEGSAVTVRRGALLPPPA